VDPRLGFAVDILPVLVDDGELPVGRQASVRPDRDPLEVVVGVQRLDRVDDDALEGRRRHGERLIARNLRIGMGDPFRENSAGGGPQATRAAADSDRSSVVRGTEDLDP